MKSRCFELTFLVQPLDMTYVTAAANLHAFNYGLKGENDPAVFRKVLTNMVVPEFTPKSGVKIQINENEPVSNAQGSGEMLAL